MIGKTNKLMKQDNRENYGYKAAEGAALISEGDDKFKGADEEFEEARAEESVFDAASIEEGAARESSQSARNLAGHVTGTASEREEDEEE